MSKLGDQAGPARSLRMLHEFAIRTSMVARKSWLDRAAEDAFEALGAVGIEARLLKGIALAQLLYKADEPRTYYDVDILVSPAKLTAAGEVFEKLGYQNLSALDGVVDVAGILHAQAWAKGEPGLGIVSIDLHWRLPGCEAPSESVWEKLSDERLSIDVGRSRLPTLALPGLALHLGLHAAESGPADVKALGDLQRGLERWPLSVWRSAADLARDLQATEAFAAGIRLDPRGIEIAQSELRLPPADVLLWEIVHRGERPRGTFHARALADAGTLRQRAVVVRHALLPPRAWIGTEYQWARPGGVRLLAAYLLHVGRSPRWAMRAWRYRQQVKRLADPG